MTLLSNIVRIEGEEEATSKFVIPCSGGITDKLKKDWGLNDVWNNIVYPRFERLNALTNTTDFGQWENKEGKRVFKLRFHLSCNVAIKRSASTTDTMLWMHW